MIKLYNWIPALCNFQLEFRFKTLTNKALSPCLFFLILGAGCVDDTYDLNNGISTDISLGGDSLYLPLGETDSLRLSKFIDDQHISEIVLENGAYYIVYSDTLKASVPSPDDYKINDLQVLSDISLPEGLSATNDIPYPSDVSFALTPVQENFSLNLSSHIERLDSALLDISGAYSQLVVDVSFQNLRLVQGDAAVNFEIQFPKELKVYDPITGSELVNAIYSKSLSLSQSSYRLNFKVKRITGADSYQVTTRQTLQIKKNGVIHVDQNPGIRIGTKLCNVRYKTIYGVFDAAINVQSGKTDLRSLTDIFDGDDNVLSFSEPRIFITTKTNIGIPATANLKLASVKNGLVTQSMETKLHVTSPLLPFNEKTSKFGIGPVPLPGWDGEVWDYTPIGNLIKTSPDYITYAFDPVVDKSVQHFYTRDAYLDIMYVAKVPFAVASDFSVSVSDTLLDVFDQDIREMLFSNGEVELFGVASTDLPLRISMSMVILDANMLSTGITLDPRQISPGVKGTTTQTDISFLVGEDQIAKMKTAEHVLVKFTITSDEVIQNTILKPDDFVHLKLKARKKGGIHID